MHDGHIDSVIEKAFEASTAAAAPPASDSPAESATARPPVAPAAGSGSESTASPQGSTGAPSTQATDGDDDASILADTPDAAKHWATPELRKTILDNARKKASDRARSDLLTSYGIPSDIPAAHLQTHIRAILNDPVGYFRWLGQDLTQRGLLQRPAAPPPPAAPERLERPKPSLRAEDGTMAYSADDMEKLLAFQIGELRKELSGQLAPLQEARDASEQERVRAEAWEIAAEKFRDMQTWDGFSELRDEIVRQCREDGRRTPESVYNRLYQDLVKKRDASREAEVRRKLLAEMNKAPSPNTPVPGAPTPTPTKRKSNSFDARLDAAVESALATHAS